MKTTQLNSTVQLALFPEMQQPKVLQGKIDAYNGVIVDHNSIPSGETELAVVLQISLEKWKNEGRKGVWIKIPLHKAHLIPVVVKEGFVFHHAEPQYVIMTKWLPSNSENKLPRPPQHYIGVGGFVVNEAKEVLVVKEKTGPATNIWKIPGGIVDAGEDIHQAVVREVFEETGIKCDFVSILGFRQHHNAAFGKSDLYFVCYLKPLSKDIKIQTDEIQDCKWMPMEELLNLPYYQGLYKKLLQLGQEAAEGRYDNAWKPEYLPIVFTKGYNVLYHNCLSKL